MKRHISTYHPNHEVLLKLQDGFYFVAAHELLVQASINRRRTPTPPLPTVDTVVNTVAGDVCFSTIDSEANTYDSTMTESVSSGDGNKTSTKVIELVTFYALERPSYFCIQSTCPMPRILSYNSK